MRKRDQSKNKFYVILPGRGLLKFTLTLFTKWVSELMHQIEEVGCVGCCPGYSRSSRALIRQDSFGSFNDASPHAAIWREYSRPIASGVNPFAASGTRTSP